MVSFVRKHRSHDQPAEEHPVVRQYRFLLRHGPSDAVEVAHVEALARLQENQRLAQAVTRSEACFGLFGPYAAWDGADPDPDEQPAWADGGFDPDTGRWHPAHDGKVQDSDYIEAYYGGRGLPHKRQRP